MARSSTTFQKGDKGNPKGRPKVAVEIKEACRALTPQAVAKLKELMKCGNPSVELSATQAVLDRAYGKPVATVNQNVQIRELAQQFAPFLTPEKRDELARYLSSIEARGTTPTTN